MYKRLINLLLIVSCIALSSNSADTQEADSYDTLRCRSEGYMLAPRYDTIKQLEKANQKADQILTDLEKIAKSLGIKDTIK